MAATTNLQAAWIEAALACQRTVNVNNLIAEIVENVHLEGAKVITPITLATTAILCREKDFLTDRVLYDVLVVGFESGKHCILRNKNVVDSKSSLVRLKVRFY